MEGTPSAPSHVAIIMDGNGRWAELQNKQRTDGHRQGVETVRTIVKAAGNQGVKTLSLFTFSSENWRRPPSEVATLFSLLVSALKEELPELIDNGVRVRFIGERSALSKVVLETMEYAERATATLDAMCLQIIVNYGGRWDIAKAAQHLMQQAAAGDDIAAIEAHLNRYFIEHSAGDVDLLIRTGGEQRLSNFLLWQSAYAEIYFTDMLWPDFDEVAFTKALEWFQSRQRRFGAIE